MNEIETIVKMLVPKIQLDTSKTDQALLVHLTFQLIQLVEATNLKGPQKLKAVQCAMLELVEQNKQLFVQSLPNDFIHEMVPLMVNQAVKLAKTWSNEVVVTKCCF